MAGQPKIEVTISAKADQLSASLAKVRKEIAGLPAMAQQASRKMGDGDFFGGGRANASMFGMDRIQKQIGKVYGSARLGAGGVTGGLGFASRTIPGLGLIAGGASIAGISEMMSSLAGEGVELTNTSRLAGTTAAGLNSMRGAARLMGLSAGTADAAMTGLNHTLQDAVFGRDNDAANAFKMAGVDIGTMRDGAKSAEAVLPRIVDTLSRVAKVNPLAAERLAQVWGIPSGALPMLIRGNEALQANRKEIERMYGSMDAYQASSERFTYSTAKLSLASEKLGSTIMTSLEPHLTPLLLSLSTWVEKHDKDIGDTFDHLGRAIQGVNWSDVGAGIDKVGTAIKTAASYADDFGTRLDRALTTINDITHGRMPRDSGIDVRMSPAQRALIYQAGSAQMRAGTLPGPEEGMSLPAAGGGRGTPRLPAAEQERRARAARDQLIGLGWTPQQAAGIVANLFRESDGMNEGAVGDGGQAGGLAQWHNDRRQAIMRQFRKPIERMSVEEQVAAVNWELDGPEKSAGDALRQAKTAAEAGDIVSRQYERPRAVDAEASVRARSADAFDRRWSGGPARSPQLTLPETAPAAANNGSLQITIDHKNVPAGVTMTPQLQSDSAELAGVRVRRAMPEAGKMPPWGYVN